METITCACGCGGPRPMFDRKGRQRRYIWGHTNGGNFSPLSKTFWPRVIKTDSCWIWIGKTDKDGYGKAWFSGKTIRANRLSWLIHRGALPPKNRMVLHTCDNPPCVNPSHLFLGDVKSNAEDAVAKGRYRCGETHTRSKLRNSDVIEIRKSFDGSPSTSEFLAARFGTTTQNIRAIGLRKTWKHVTAA